MVRPPIIEDINHYIRSGVRDEPRRLTVDDKLMIIWGLTRGWGEKHIATYLKMHRSTVRSYKVKIAEDPQIVFEQLPLYTRIEARKFRCRICGEHRPARVAVMRHVLMHFLPRDLALGSPLDRVEKPI